MRQPVSNIVSTMIPGLTDRRYQRRSSLMLAILVLLWWGHLVLGPDFPALVGGVITVLAALWVLRRRPAIAACAGIAAATAGVLAVTCVVVMDQQIADAADMVAVLTGFGLVAPVPAVLACTLRPVLVTAPVNALLGSAVLLLGAVPVVVFGDHGQGAALLAGALITAIAVMWIRHRRAAATLLASQPALNGWTDLGRRTLPDGSEVDRLLVGRGQAIACSTATATVTERAYLSAARRAAAAATVIGLPPSSVQPVILSGGETPGLERHLVRDGCSTASVIVISTTMLDAVTRLAPRRWRSRRRAVLTAALLPTSAERTPAR